MSAWLRNLSASIALTAVCTGCAVLEPWLYPQANPVIPLARSHPTAVPSRDFEMTGRFSLAWNDQHWIGGIDWKFRPAYESLALSVAGQAFAQFERYEGQARGQLTNGQTFEAASWSDLTQRAIGVRLPLEYAPDWVRGQPASGQPFDQRADDQFNQAGWAITVLARAADGRAQRLRWSKERVSFTLVIDQWLPN
jgi:outer membrane lipoprotein LolB